MMAPSGRTVGRLIQSIPAPNDGGIRGRTGNRYTIRGATPNYRAGGAAFEPKLGLVLGLERLRRIGSQAARGQAQDLAPLFGRFQCCTLKAVRYEFGPCRQLIHGEVRQRNFAGDDNALRLGGSD